MVQSCLGGPTKAFRLKGFGGFDFGLELDLVLVFAMAVVMI